MAQNKKLLFISTVTSFGGNVSYGGGEFFAKEFLCELSRRGWEVVFVSPPGNPLLDDDEFMRCITRSIPLELSCGIRQPARFFSTLWRWLRILKTHQEYLLYGNAFQSLKWLAMGSTFFPIRTICHLHESSYKHYHSLRARILALRIERFIAISESVKALFVEGSRISPEKISIVHNGVAINVEVEKLPSQRDSMRRELELPLTGYLVMMAARTDPLKGHEIFLRAAAEVLKTRADAHFLVVGFEGGEGSQVKLHQELLRLMDQLGIRQSIRVLGHTDRVRLFMRVSDIVVVPSTAEGFGRTAIEAMAEKTALIASRVGGLEEILQDHETAILFENRNWLDLADKITSLLTHQETREKLAVRGHQAAVDSFLMSRMTDKIERLLGTAEE
jgi:glycosyltransferase involved in cell wall biosynthesis